MKLNDPNTIDFDGTPVTGRVPPKLRVEGGRELTQQQAGAVMHAYKLFRDAARVSITDYQVQNRVLSDGTRVRLESIQDQDTVYVWPPESSGGYTDVFRGFVVSPIKVSGYTMPAALDKNFLCYIHQDTKWKPFIAPYKPGEKRKDLGYIVTATPFVGGPSKRAPRYRGRPVMNVDCYTGKRVGRCEPVSDAQFNDVFSVYQKIMYLNAVPVKGFVSAPSDAMPLPFRVTRTSGVRTWQEYDALFLLNHQIIAVAEDLTDTDSDLDTTEVIQQVVYSFNDFFVPILSGLSFKAGVELKGGYGPADAASYKTRYIGYNKLVTGAVQIWNAVKTLSITAPFASTALEATSQLNVPGAVNSSDGWTYTVANDSWFPPRFMVLSGAQKQFNYLMQRTAYLTFVFSGYVQYNDVVARPGESSIYRYTFEKTHSLPESVTLNEAEAIAITRSVEINLEYTTGTANYYGVWPNGTISTSNNASPYGLADPSPGRNYYSGDIATWALICTDNGETVDQTDDTEHTVTVPLIASKIVDLTVNRVVTGRAGGTQLFTQIGTYPNGVYLWDNNQLVVPRSGSGYTTSAYHASIIPVFATHDLIGYTRDYFYADRENQVFAYLECEIRSSAVSEFSRLGTSSITVRTVIEAFGSTHKTTITGVSSSSGTTSRYMPTTMPWGINWGVSSMATNYHDVPRIDPIYAPIWQEQGLCPWISYTVAGEIAPPRLDCHFRMQFFRTVRLIDEPDVPSLPNVIQFAPYLMEQMIGHYWLTINEFRDVFDALEAAPIIVKLTIPDATLFSNIGAPVSDVQDYAKFYRT